MFDKIREIELVNKAIWILGSALIDEILQIRCQKKGLGTSIGFELELSMYDFLINKLCDII